ncbi:hypothetical protein BDZ45DRAFT_797496 [Acephala macrosclerotiorum]|nr:hypothetical protein BDZ45DRAFT_797496 [Acephala macrosclerotiorum]
MACSPHQSGATATDTNEQREEKEASFFSDSGWLERCPQASLARPRGTSSPTPRLPLERITERLPSVKYEVQSDIKDCISENLSTMIQAAIDEVYSDPFFTSFPEQQDTLDRQLRPNVQKILTICAGKMCLHGHALEIVENDQKPTPKSSSKCIMRSSYPQDVKKLMAGCGGCELPGPFNPLVVRDLFIVTCLNFLKCFYIFLVFWWRSEHTLCTLGDAIASFLEFPDPHTNAIGLSSKESLKPTRNWPHTGTFEWHLRLIRWFRAASFWRWLFTMITSGAILIAGCVMLGQGLHGVQSQNSRSPEGLWIQGFNGKHPTSKQREWRQYAKERKTLRVSHPRGIQRSTYFISMPLRYRVPKMGMFSLLHWLLSQSCFILRVIVIDTASSTTPFEDTKSSWTMLGYTVTLGGLSLALQVLNGLRIFLASSAMPLAASCSAIIGANCHRPKMDVDTHLLPVQWGVNGYKRLGE